MIEDYLFYNEYYQGYMTRADFIYLFRVISKQQDGIYVLAKHRHKKNFSDRWVKPITRSMRGRRKKEKGGGGRKRVEIVSQCFPALTFRRVQCFG